MLTKTSFSTMSRMAAEVEFRAPDPEKPMGYRRLIISAASILTGLGMIYVAMHYVPAMMHSTQKLDLAQTEREGRDPLTITSKYGPILGPYVDAFFMKRTYLEAGQTIQIRYRLPPGASMDLKIRQCKRAFAIEVFKCTPVAEKSVAIEQGQGGVREFAFPQTGFYHFEETVTLPEPEIPYRIVWSRQ